MDYWRKSKLMGRVSELMDNFCVELMSKDPKYLTRREATIRDFFEKMQRRAEESFNDDFCAVKDSGGNVIAYKGNSFK